MKLRQFAASNDQTYSAAYRQFQRGEIPGAYQLDSGTIIVPEDEQEIIIRGTPEQLYHVTGCLCSGMSVTQSNIQYIQLGNKNE